MAADRLVSFIFLLVGIFLILTAQYVGVAALDPTREAMLDIEDCDTFKCEQHMNEMYKAATVWAPLTGGAGLVILAMWREWRRQKRAAARQTMGGPRL